MARRDPGGDLRLADREGKFPEEERAHGASSPGVVRDDEDLERRLPPGAGDASGLGLPLAAFPRSDLQWTAHDGGASVDRSRYGQGEVSGRRGSRGTIKAKAIDIRRLTDAQGIRLWSVTDRPVPENRAHAEIQREPRGKMPSRAERERFMAVWRGAIALLTTLREGDPLGTPELQLVRDTGVEVHWRSGRDNHLQRVVQVESVAEAIRAYIGAGLVSEGDAAQERCRLEQELLARMADTQRPCVGTGSHAGFERSN